MNRNFIIAGLIVILFIVGVYIYRVTYLKPAPQPTSPTTSQTAVKVTPTVMQKTVTAVYTGKLPCADCEGINAVLTLYDDETYSMTNTYLGKDVKPYEEKGKWTTLRGDATDENATVYQLYDQEGQQSHDENYLLQGEKLIPLDEDLKLIESPFDMSLTKKAS